MSDELDYWEVDESQFPTLTAEGWPELSILEQVEYLNWKDSELYNRKLLMFALGVVRSGWDAFPPETKRMLVMQESALEGTIYREEEWRHAYNNAWGTPSLPAGSNQIELFIRFSDLPDNTEHGYWAADVVCVHEFAREEDDEWYISRDFLKTVLADLIFKSPFHTVPWDDEWSIANMDHVLRLTTEIYNKHQFERMPELGQALEEAGCEDQDIPKHCQQKTTHYRGCWLLDAILGKHP